MKGILSKLNEKIPSENSYMVPFSRRSGFEPYLANRREIGGPTP